MRAFLIFAACLSSAFAQPSTVKLPKEWKGKDGRELLERADFNSMPFHARDLVMVQTDADYRKLSIGAALIVLLEKEKDAAQRARRVAVDTIVGWTEDNPDCWTRLIGGNRSYGCSYGSAAVALHLERFEKFIRAGVSVGLANNSQIEIDVVPQAVSLVSLNPKLSSWKQIDAKRIADKYASSAQRSSAIVVGLGALATTTETSTTRGSFSGNRIGYGTYSETTVSRVPDTAARDNTRRQAAEMIELAQQRSGAVLRDALLGTTLSAGQTAQGYVYFEKGDDFARGVIRVQIGRVSFEFPLESPAK